MLTARSDCVPIESRCMADAPGFDGLYRTGAAGAVLLRPDGFIAWRARSAAPEDAGAVLTSVLRQILALA